MHRFITHSLIVAFLLGGAFSISARAADEIIVEGSTAPVRGEITNVSRTEITILAGLKKEEQKVPANTIVRVEWDGEPSKLSLNRNAEAAARYPEALAGYQEALTEVASSTNTNLKNDLTFLIARAKAGLALTSDASKLDEAIKDLEAFRTANSNSFRYYQTLSLLGDLYLAKKNYEQALAIFNEMAQAPWDDYKMAAANARGRVKLADGKAAEAQQEFDSIVALTADTPQEKAQRLRALLGKATALQRQNQPAEAQTVIDEVLEQAETSDSRTLAEGYVRLGESLQAQNKPKEALLAYLHVDAIPDLANEAQYHAEALLQLSQLWTVAGKPERATDAQELLKSKYPTSDAARRLSAGGAAGGGE
ncbi:MAG: tetratricopeptide repeat protein [Planctomycetes bacterium]|nr:tetratricopeptide repeat protein [Planctomycetota bacterium]